MTHFEVQRLARLRGKLTADQLGTNGPGARGLERLARNPACLRLRALIMAGISPAVAEDVIYGGSSDELQSPFALGTGNKFERSLFESGAARFLDPYRKAGRLRLEECKVTIIPDLVTGKGELAQAQRLTETNRLLRRKLQGEPSAPNVIVKPRVRVALLGAEYEIEPDALVAADSDAFYRIVEIKSYPDRRGKTDAKDIRSAARQAAVGILGLRYTLGQMGVFAPASLIPPVADLILRRPGSMYPSLTPLPLPGELYSIERAFNEAPRDLNELEAILNVISLDAALDDPSVLNAIPNNYIEGCREHCPLAQRCKSQAITDGNPVLLGGFAREELAAAGSIGRALDLLYGRGAPPRSAEEKLLQERLRAASREYERAING